jgi:hypothetical protein
MPGWRAGGGVVGAVVQTAKARGCRVIAVNGSPPSPESAAGRMIDDYVATKSLARHRRPRRYHAMRSESLSPV